MNKTLNKIVKIIKDTTKEYLPEVTSDILLENGSIYYMNDIDSTLFDWGMNGRCCEFMTFYKESDMGAIKVNVMDSGKIMIYVYKNKATSCFKTLKEEIEAKEALELVVLMNKIADERNLFGESLDKMETSLIISNQDIDEFTKKFKE